MEQLCYKSIGERIKRLRKARGLTLDEIAIRFKTSAYRWRQYEEGKKIPSSKLLSALADHFVVRVEYFLNPDLHVPFTPEELTEVLRPEELGKPSRRL